MRYALLCAAIAAVTSSCVNHGIRGGDDEEYARANTAFAELPSVIRDSAGGIRITDDCRGFTSRFIVGYAHRGGPLCVRKGRVGRAVIWHECAHPHYHTLSREAIEEWEAIVPEELFRGHGVNIAIPGAYPSCGIITSYGGVSPSENYAEWVTWLMHYLRGYGTAYGRVDLACVDRSDARYLRILTFFRDHDVITEPEFERVLPLFYDHSR